MPPLTDLANLAVLILFVAAVAGWAGGLGRFVDRKVFHLGRPVVVIESAGDTATEDYAKWFHAQASCATDVTAGKPAVTVWARDDPKSPGYERWKAVDDRIELGADSLHIPIVVGNLDENYPKPLLDGRWMLEPRTWYLTPDRSYGIGRPFATFSAGARYRFDVKVSWIENGRHKNRHETLELRFLAEAPHAELVVVHKVFRALSRTRRAVR